MASFLLLASLSLAFLCICQADLISPPIHPSPSDQGMGGPGGYRQADLISDICSKAANPQLCIQTLSSEPRSRGANFQTLSSEPRSRGANFQTLSSDPRSRGANHLISGICSTTTNPQLCIQTLSSDPRSRGANAVGLGLIAIHKSKAATQDFIKVVKASSTEKIKETVGICVETGNDAIDDLKELAQQLKSYSPSPIQKDDIVTKASAVYTNVETCDDEFESYNDEFGEGREAEPLNVKAAIGRAQEFNSILLHVVNAL